MFDIQNLIWLLPAQLDGASSQPAGFDPRNLIVLIPLLPLIASVVIALISLRGPSHWRPHCHWPCIIGIVGACLLSFLTFALVAGSPGAGWVKPGYTWFETESIKVEFALRADALSAIMLVVITFVGSLIAIYSAGYMHGDPAYPRFFAAIALFIFSMTTLVLGDNFLVLFAGWEGVGLCSYLLIGFWYARPSAAAAARKAFLVTRIGDAGFILGIILLWLMAGNKLDYDSVFKQAKDYPPDMLAAACLLLFCGAVGKSAQFPLHVWLPDAMEGPSPVSALIHAATMVTAGVYLVARCMPLFHNAPDYVLLTVACIGAFTALLAGLIALTQNDLKRVLAYSTVSQLGYMFLALGCAKSKEIVGLAVMAAIFHLFTHAFFKALLFLSAGSVMHAMGNVIDMRRFSGLRHVLPKTHWAFLCGAAALAGVPFLSGFWSKDDILAAALHASHDPTFGRVYMVLFISALITAGLTAFYTFRAYFMTFWGEKKIPSEAGHHAHESPPVMVIPLMILAVGAVGIGIVIQPFTHWLSHFFEQHWMSNSPGWIGILPEGEGKHDFNLPLMIGSSLFGLVGIAVAWLMYVRQPSIPRQLAESIQGLYQLSLNKFHFDELYVALLVQPVTWLAEACRVFDHYVVDGLVDLVGALPAMVGKSLRPIQNGLVQFYALAMMAGLVVFLVAMASKLAW